MQTDRSAKPQGRRNTVNQRHEVLSFLTREELNQCKQLPSISVLGIIAIPGMMTGAILGGSSVQQAARLQMIIMFMITASTTLASVFVTIAAVVVSVDAEHRVRSERIVKNGSRIGLWAWFVRVLKGEARKEAVNWRENVRPESRRGWMDSVRSLKSLRTLYRGEEVGRNDEAERRSDERTRLLA